MAGREAHVQTSSGKLHMHVAGTSPLRSAGEKQSLAETLNNVALRTMQYSEVVDALSLGFATQGIYTPILCKLCK